MNNNLMVYPLITYNRPLFIKVCFRGFRIKSILKKISMFYIWIKRGFDLLRFDKKGFISYKNYADKVAFIDRFYFEQKTRKENIKNINGVGKKWI